MSSNDKKEYCSCEDWSVCCCGGEGPAHCMYCCLDLTAEQLKTVDEERKKLEQPR